MRERIARLKQFYITEKGHHADRTGTAVDPAPYRDPSLPDHRRTALRLKAALEAETPVIRPFEELVFTRTVPNAPLIFSDAEWAEIRGTHYIHENGNVCNLAMDYAKVLACGLTALRERLGDTPHDESTRICIDAVLALTKRYAALARAQSREELACVLDRVPAYGARSFREALQSLRILHYAMWCEGDYHNTLGRFDQYMLPYLGDTDGEDALEWIEEFFLSCNRDSDLYPGMQQGDNGQSMVLSGMTPEGKDGTNALTYLCLKACGELRVIDPKINLRVNGETPLSLFEEGTRLTKLGLGFPQYENDDEVIPALERIGYRTEDARNYVVAACWEFIIPGRGMDIPNIGAVCMASVADRAIRNALPGASSMDAVLDECARILREDCARIAEGVGNLYVIPSPYLSLFFDLAPGADIADGCVYNNYGLHGTGISTAADSLAAAEQKVFGESMDPAELIRAMDRDFEGDPALRHSLTECPKMGNDDDRADRFAQALLDRFADAAEPLRNEHGGRFRVGTGAAMYYIWHAAELGATADGRKKGTPLSANYSPALDVRTRGPVSLLRSFSKADLRRCMNGGPVTIEFHDSVFLNDESITKAASLVQAFIRWGGHQLQLNTVNADLLREAQAEPDRFRSLIVRVWGWSGYFVELDKCYQDHIIRRAELRL